MSAQTGDDQDHSARANSQSEIEKEPGLVDAIRFLYQRRVRLAVYFLAILAIITSVYLFRHLMAPQAVEGTLRLGFQGIERHEYPNGKRFNIEDLRGPDLLAKALAASGISAESVQIQDLAAHVNITPLIPADIQARWRKAEKDATPRGDFYPNEFEIVIDLPGLSSLQRVRLFDAVVRSYQERVKNEQKSALSFVASWNTSYERLAKDYDYWDIPDLFRESYSLLNRHVTTLITEAAGYPDSTYQLSFREIDKELRTWYRTRFQALEALTYQGQLVRNRDLVIQRIQYRIQDLDIQIRQQTQEAADAMRLLEAIDRPKAMLAGQLSNKEGLPLIDATALDRLIKSDYVGPVVQRISTIQGAIQGMQTEKARLEKQLSWLPKSSNAGQIPAGYQELFTPLSSELNTIIKNYNQLLDDYLTETITNLVVILRSPTVVTADDSGWLVRLGIVFLSMFLAIALIGIQRLLEKARE
jgi:hypothetical protein